MIDPNEDFCRKLCEEVGLVSRPYAEEYHGVEEWAVESAMSAISKAIQIVMEKASELSEASVSMRITPGQKIIMLSPGGIPLPLAIRSLQLSAEDVADSLRKEGI